MKRFFVAIIVNDLVSKNWRTNKRFRNTIEGEQQQQFVVHLTEGGVMSED